MAEEILIGRIAVQKGFLTQAQMDEAVALQSATSPRRPLGEILVEQGFLTATQVATLLGQQGAALQKTDAILPRPRADSLFGKLAVRMKCCSQEQLNEALRLQAEAETTGEFRQLGDILVERGWMSPAGVRQVLEGQERSLLWCAQCNSVFNVAHVVKRTARCPNCGTVLEEAAADQVSADAQIAFTPDGMRIASLKSSTDESDEGEPVPQPVGTIVARRFSCEKCGAACVVLVRRGDDAGVCPSCRASNPI